MGALALTQEIQPDVAVIFATGYRADISLLHKVQHPGLPVIQKPYTPHTFARKIRRAKSAG
jgi:hypothetical protein